MPYWYWGCTIRTMKEHGSLQDAVDEATKLMPYWWKARRELGLTQDKIAELLGVTQGAVHKWFAGKQRIPNERLLELAPLLRFDPTEIRPELERFVRPVTGLSPSEDALMMAHMFDKLDDQAKAAVETVISGLFAASKSQRNP